jgi:hypothetical protein
MKALIIISISFATLTLAAPTAVHRNAQERRSGKIDSVKHYGKSVVGRGALLRSGASAGFSQLTNSPHEWGRGGSGFGKRFGSSLATSAIGHGIHMGVGSILHEENSHYVRVNQPGFMPKFKSAAEQTFWVKHKNSNKRYPAYGRMSGAFGSGLISRAWMPARLHTVSSGVATGGVALGADFGMNLAREYMPNRHKRLAQARR